MAGSVILMAANGYFTNKTFLLQRLKRQVLVSEVSFVKREEVFYLILADIYLQVTKSICLILPNYQLINPLMIGGKKSNTYLNLQLKGVGLFFSMCE